MGLFHKVEGAHVILYQKGVHRQRSVYTRDDRLYAGIGGNSFVALHSNGTSKSDLSWQEIFGIEHRADELGRLVTVTFRPQSEQNTRKRRG